MWLLLLEKKVVVIKVRQVVRQVVRVVIIIMVLV